MSKRNSAEVLLPEIVDVKIEEDEDDPLEMINEEQFDNPKTRPKLTTLISTKAPKRLRRAKKECKKNNIISGVGGDGGVDKAALPIKVLTCARLEIEIYGKSNATYKLKCAHCETKSLLTEWKAFVKHLEKEHSSIIETVTKEENYIEIITCLPEVAPTVPSEEAADLKLSAVNKPTIKTEKTDSDYEDFGDDEAPDDNDYTPGAGSFDDIEPLNEASKTQKFRKSEYDGDEDDKSNYKKKDQIITFSRTDKEVVFGFLELLKLHPLLWHRRQSIIQRYDKVLLEMAAKFHAKFPKHKLSTNEMRGSIYRIKKLYDAAVNPPKKETDSEATFKIKFPKYFEMCTEIEEESKKISKKCEHCGLNFIDEIDLQVHAFQMHRVGELPFKCKRCSRRFASEAKLAYHEKKDHAELQFPCLICDKSFDKESRLHSHMSLHVGAKQICEICGKSFDSSYRYRRHMLHHAPPQFKCELCGKMLYEKYTLSEHMKTHYNQRNYACEICGKTFNINNGLQIHRRQVHKVKTQYVWGKKAPTNEQPQTNVANISPASSVNLNETASAEMTPSITAQHSLLEAPESNAPLTHAVFQDRLINDLLNLQQQQQLHQGRSPQQSGLRPGTDPREILAKDCQPSTWMQDKQNYSPQLPAPQPLQQQLHQGDQV